MMTPSICPQCGTVGFPKTIAPSNFGIEAGIWIIGLAFSAAFTLWLLIVPVGYSIWRGASAKKGCQQCKQPGMIPVNTPRGQELCAQFGHVVGKV